VATGIVVICGLAVVMRIESGNEQRRLEVAGLCALMLLIFALALIVPFLRHFYELATPTGDAAIAWAVGAGIGMLGALRQVRVWTAKAVGLSEYCLSPSLARARDQWPKERLEAVSICQGRQQWMEPYLWSDVVVKAGLCCWVCSVLLVWAMFERAKLVSRGRPLAWRKHGGDTANLKPQTRLDHCARPQVRLHPLLSGLATSPRMEHEFYNGRSPSALSREPKNQRERAWRSGPMLTDYWISSAAKERAQDEDEDEYVVELTGDRNEIEYEVEGKDEISAERE
jgi:hypothetical protein